MKNLKIDEKHIQELKICMQKNMLILCEDMEVMGNKKEILYRRYTAFTRILSYISIFNQIDIIQRNCFVLGFDMNDSYFKSKEYDESGWDKIKLEDNPFFIREKHEEMKKGHFFELKGSDLPDHLKDALIQHFKDTVLNKKEESDDDPDTTKH